MFQKFASMVNPDISNNNVVSSSCSRSVSGEKPRAVSSDAEKMARGIANSHVVRWYVMTLPTSSAGDFHGNPGRGLQMEAERRERCGEPSFDFFAPKYQEVKDIKGKLVRTNCPLLYNYVFVHSSEVEIMRIKKFQPRYNFLSRVRDDAGCHFPYLSDRAMENLRWVAASYSNELPVYTPDPQRLMKGDRVRIIAGAFEGVEAEVVIQPGGGRKDVMVRVEGCMWVPLLSVKPGEYEVIELNTEARHVYTRMANERLPQLLHDALLHFHANAITDVDRRAANEVVAQYGKVVMDSDVMRCKLYSLLLPAYLVLGRKGDYADLSATIKSILPLIKAEQSLALLLVTLYGCTDSSLFFDRAHAVVDAWKKATVVKKSKLILIERLADFDRAFGH